MARPNILVILADACRGEALDPASPCLTPTLDRLAERGVRFTCAHSSSPACSPSRASLMTGLLPHNHGVLQVEHCVDEDQCSLRTRHPHWAQRLAAAGYRTGYAGKWHIGRTDRTQDFGWRYDRNARSPEYRAAAASRRNVVASRAFDPRLSRWFEGRPGYDPWLLYAVTDVPPGDRPVSVPAEMGLRFIEENLPRRDPWCLCVSFPEPNDELVCSRSTFERYDLDRVGYPQGLDADLSHHPAIYRRLRDSFASLSREDWRMALACYYARITEVDAMVGRLLDAVERAGRTEDTLIVFASDHGRQVGARGMDGHNVGAFEEVYRIPMIVAGPGVASGAESRARVGLHDLCPTLLELAGLPGLGAPDSRSFASVLGDPASPENGFHTGYAENFGTRYWITQRVLWQDEWKLVFNGFDDDELYHLGRDPSESVNLAADRSHGEMHERLMAELWRIVRETGDRTLGDAQWFGLRFPVVGPGCAPRGR